jgi:hypothetical protein
MAAPRRLQIRTAASSTSPALSSHGVASSAQKTRAEPGPCVARLEHKPSLYRKPHQVREPALQIRVARHPEERVYR